ncbi:MAG: hypothetical protein KAT29_03045 [Anaerolineales bacterium]|nr:hypothetical protein [Anaerolineales bacterium]
MNWIKQLLSDPTNWLLEDDDQYPGVRYLTLKDVLGKSADDPEVIQAQNKVMTHGVVPAILHEQHQDGYWCEAGPGYYPKYRGTVWQVCHLAQFGADGTHKRVKKACDYVLDHARSEYGGFSMNGQKSGMIQCLQGNLGAAFLDLKQGDDKRLQEALNWLANSITGDEIAPAEDRNASPRYYRSGNSGPGFHCSANDHLPCAWGAVKAMSALTKIPEGNRTREIQKAINQGVEFLFSCNPATAEYPMGYASKPNRSWFKFGYPIGYVTDVLQIIEVLANLGYGNDPRLQPALELITAKSDQQGRWNLEYTYNGKTWVHVEELKKPSKWVTLRVMRVLTQAEKHS